MIRRNSKGYTLVEVLVAMSILAIATAAATPAFVRQLHANTQSEIRAGAIAVAQDTLDALRSGSIQTLPSSGTDGPFDADGGKRTYQVQREYCAISAYCPSNNTRHIKVHVSYHGTTVFTAETVLTRLD